MVKIQEILDLSVEERISMVEKIWDSINPDHVQISTSHEEELDSRLNRYKSGETTFYSWTEIKNELNTPD